MKKFIAIATTATIALMAAGPALGATAAELQAQIDALLAQIAVLQAQIGGGASVGAPAACAGITFTRNLTVGSTGSDVKCLQALLNQSADTQVAASGVGSTGSETMYFGNLTKGGVVKYQNKYAATVLTPLGLTAGTGFFGPSTRTKANAALAGAPGTPGTPGTPGVPGTCTGTEGSYTATLSSSPVTRTVNGGTGIEAYGIDVTAYNSDTSIGSIDLQTGVTVAGVTWNPSTFITKIKVYIDSVSDANLVKTFDNPTYTLDTASLYYTSLTGLNLKVPIGTTHKVLIVIDTVESTDNNRVVTLNVYGTGIRGRDCIGIDRFTALATTRVLTIQPASGNATLTLSAAAETPDSKNILTDVTNGVGTDTTLLVFRAKAASGSTTLTRVGLSYASGASEAVPSVLKLKSPDGTTLSTCTPGATQNGFCTFENFRYPIAQNTTESLKVDANWAAPSDRNHSFRALTIPATSANNVFERSNGSVVNATVSNAIIANTVNVYEEGAQWTLVSSSATGGIVSSTAVGTATGTFKFKVVPFGGTLTQIANATPSSETVNAVFVEAYWSSSTTVGVGASSTTLVRTLAQNPARNLNDGEEGTVDVTMSITASETCGTGTLRFKVEGVQWTVGTRNMYEGDFFASDNLSGNLTDTWFTPWFHSYKVYTLILGFLSL